MAGRSNGSSKPAQTWSLIVTRCFSFHLGRIRWQEAFSQSRWGQGNRQIDLKRWRERKRGKIKGVDGGKGNRNKERWRKWSKE